ncbi:UNKNOWN [Stylonychia lemnae]|uniref:Uncharacterized protein n=1 Tax=Stylonychia lemnae TaxID=5949 RepID=A0A078ALJ7_STYLE|nr:UNKNOWN [Stylonychia lemnae]|eukprot:CDW82746.1 UNKNOWN [Stylonychia lemnae]
MSFLEQKKNLSFEVFFKGADELDNKFRNKFIEKHRKLKAKIHQCQYSAYANEGIAYAEAEDRARKCFLPMMLIRRHATTIMENSRDDFMKCLDGISHAEIYVPGADLAKNKCLHEYKNKLKTTVPVVHSYYDGYLQNYSSKDGSLVGDIKDTLLSQQNAQDQSKNKDTNQHKSSDIL